MTKKMRIYTALCLAGVIGMSTAGCGNSEETKAAVDDQDNTAGDIATADPDSSEDMEEIHVLYPSLGPVPAGLEAVEAEINAITEKEINTHVNISIYEIGNYDQQVGLMMSSSESVDLMLTLPSGSAGFSSMQMQGQLMDITELLEEYGAPVLETVGSLIQGTSVGGKVYGVCGYRNLVSGEYIVMRTDVLEDLGLLEKAQNMTSFSEYEEILAAVAASDQWSYLSGLVGSGQGNTILQQGGFCSGDAFADMELFDTLGDTYKVISINPDGSGPKVRMTYGTEEYRKIYERVKKWYDAGYVYKDSATTQETGTDLIKNNVGFSVICDGEYGIEASKAADCGMPVTCVKIMDYPITTGSCTKFTWVIPSTSKSPEAAVGFMNMMYTDSRIANLLAWGIEGVDYEVVDGEACFIEGNENPAYHTMDFLYGNQFITLPWEGSGANMRDETLEGMKNAVYSEYMGFSCDTSSVTNEISAVSNCLSEFRPQIETGMASEEIFNDFLEKLEASNVDKIVDCYQQQLNTWLEGRNE